MTKQKGERCGKQGKNVRFVVNIANRGHSTPSALSICQYLTSFTTVVNLERAEGTTFVILVRCLPTTKEWHGIKVKLSDQKKKEAQPGIKG